MTTDTQEKSASRKIGESICRGFRDGFYDYFCITFFKKLISKLKSK